MGRAPCCEKMGLKKGPWTPDEDGILTSYITQHGHSNWRALPKQAGLLRCGKSCRLRWINYLRPDIKRGNFSQEEEETIINLHQLLGNRWSAIAARLPGRTDNEIKNVWHTHLKKKLTHPAGNGSTTAAAAAMAINAAVVPTRKRARKAKAAAKKVPKKENSLEPNDSDEGTTDRNVMAVPEPVVKTEPVSPQPCTSEVSTVTSISTSTGASGSENDNCSKENAGGGGGDNQDITVGEILPEINDDFWMEVLSVKDTAMSTEDHLPSISQGDANTCDDALLGTTLNNIHSEDMDVFWNNLLTKSHDLPELVEMLWKSDVQIS